MQQVNRIQIVFFSGTGGVQKIADAFGRELESRGIAADLYSLDASLEGKMSETAESPELILLLFPLHAFDAPDPVFEWISQAPLGGKKVAVISVSGGGEAWPNTGCRNSCCKALENRGATVLYEYMMCMPSNWVFQTNDHAAMWLIRAIPGKVTRILDDILSGKTRRTHLKKSVLRSYITRLEKRGARTFPQRLTIDDACTGCGLCAARCPVSNIELKDRRPLFKDRCVMCFRCIYACPAHAIKSKNFMVLKNGYNLSALEKRMQGVELEPIEKCCGGFMWTALRNYLLDKDF